MKSTPSHDMQGLLALMAQLRSADGGCPWDREQDFHSIAPYTIEEAYEVAEAVASGSVKELRDELGDLLFQVVFHAQMAAERGWFDFQDVTAGIVEKMIRRHPHVFGDTDIKDSAAQTLAWEAMKAAERAQQTDPSALVDASALAGIGAGMPEMAKAVKLTKRAATVGFDWPDPKPVLDKLHEEIDEFREALTHKDAAAQEDEFGDMLFVLVNLARHYRIDPQAALRGANRKFERRFRGMELLARERGTELQHLSLADQDALWDEMKRHERGAQASDV